MKTGNRQPEIGDCKKIFCNTCQTETNHQIKHIHRRYTHGVYLEFPMTHTVNIDEPIGDLFTSNNCDEIHEYRFCVCLGCDTAIIEEAFTFDGLYWFLGDENDDWDDRRQAWWLTWHPGREESALFPKRFFKLNKGLRQIYREVIDAYNVGASVLCSMGLRALLEGICVDKGIPDSGKTRTLTKKLEELKNRNLVPSNIVDGLHHFKFIGDNAAHKLESPQTSDLALAIQIIEDLLNFLYELEYKVKKLPQSKK